MSYLHCPTCRCAYNVAREAACPRCGVQPGAPTDPTEDVVAAADQLARALARATPAQLASAEAVLDRRAGQLALPAPGQPVTAQPALLRAVRAAIDPLPLPLPLPLPDPVVDPLTQPTMLATVVFAVLDRLSATRTWARLQLPAPAAPTSLRASARASAAWARARLAAPVSRARALFARAA